MITLQGLADRFGGKVIGPGTGIIRSVASLADAGPEEITFLADSRYRGLLEKTRAGAILVGPDGPSHIQARSAGRGGIGGRLRPHGPPHIIDRPLWVVDEPLYVFSRVIAFFCERPAPPLGVSSQAVIGEDVSLGKDLSIHPLAVVSDRCRIGDRVRIYPGVYIGGGCEIGEDTLIYPNVTIREGSVIGRRVILHSGCVIGADGYGFVTRQGRHHKIPQVGTVRIEDDVELGANVTVDRATLGQTVVGRGTKVDNLVQIGHNVTIGENCLLVAQVGIAGSARIGSGVTLAGQVGVAGHLEIGDRTTIAARGGVTKSLPGGGVYAGMPAIPHAEWARAQATFTQLPQIRRELRQALRRLEAQVTALTKKKLNQKGRKKK